MTRLLSYPILGIILLCLVPPSHGAASTTIGVCQAATADAEVATGVPNQLLDAISRVESGRYDNDAQGVRAWPWTINAQGQGHYYATKAEAVTAARAFQAAGIRSIDVGCMQINLMFHPEGFPTLEAAFDPHANAVYAARFLIDLFHQTGSWPHAAAAYHSQTPNLGIDYQHKVLEAWAEPVDRPAQTTGHRSVRVSNSPAPAPVDTGSDSSSGSSPLIASVAERPLGGFGHIIREPGGTSRGTFLSTSGRDLAAYRAMPVRVAFLPPRGLRD